MASQDTISKFLIAEGSANDPALRSKLEPRVQNADTDIVVANNGSKLTIDTQGVQLQATIANTDYSGDKTYFEGLQTQIAAWQKGGGSSPAPAPMAPVTSFDIPSPAPVMPASPPAPSVPSPPPAMPVSSPPAFPSMPSPPPAMPTAPSPPPGWTPQPPSPPPSGGSGGFPPPSTASFNTTPS